MRGQDGCNAWGWLRLSLTAAFSTSFPLTSHVSFVLPSLPSEKELEKLPLFSHTKSVVSSSNSETGYENIKCGHEKVWWLAQVFT